MSKFVVLLHRPGAKSPRTSEVHADWMFQSGEVLLTWASTVPSNFEHSFRATAEKLADHRLRYLDYEGEISDGRGDVSRLLRGEYELIKVSNTELIARLVWATHNQMQHEAEVSIQRRSLADGEAIRTEAWDLRFDFGLNETKR